jgi:magnesium-protoporphyrin O-methyltransferase
VDASPAYLDAAKQEAERSGLAGRVTYLSGDFVEVAAEIPGADLVTLDRVICCYPDLPRLLGEAAARADRVLGLVYPRDNRVLRLAVRIHNFLRRMFRHPFRAYIHPSSAVDTLVRERGLRRTFYRTTLLWQVVVYTRPEGE